MKQKGFSLIEVLVALPVGTAILLVIVASFFQIMQGRVDIAQKSVAMADIDSAAHWLARDLPMAQITSLIDETPPTSSMTMSWSDLTNWAQDEGTVEHSVSYVLSETQLLRNYDGEVTIVGRYLTNVGFSIDDRVFTVTLTSRPGLPGSAVTRSFSTEMRADLPP